MPPEWKTIKIPLRAYDDAKVLRAAIAHVGVDALPAALRDQALADEAGGSRGVGIGTVVMLGLMALEDIVGTTPGRGKRAAKPRGSSPPRRRR